MEENIKYVNLPFFHLDMMNTDFNHPIALHNVLPPRYK